MNEQNLTKIIEWYDSQYEPLINHVHEEYFKWIAVKTFYDTWHFRRSNYTSFPRFLSDALKDSDILIDNSHVQPASGIIKLAESYPEEVEHLFRDVLFADYQDLKELQCHMDSFIEACDELRKKRFPDFYRFKQDHHSASCYLALYAPTEHYIYRHSDADRFARFIEFGEEIGCGSTFRLPTYYHMADLLCEALREHTTLMQKYSERIQLFDPDSPYYRDHSLHLLAFDLMYCANVHGGYQALAGQ